MSRRGKTSDHLVIKAPRNAVQMDRLSIYSDRAETMGMEIYGGCDQFPGERKIIEFRGGLNLASLTRSHRERVHVIN